MNLNNQRVLYSNNGSLTDVSVEVNDYEGEYEITAFVAAEDYLYFGSPLPFNQKYFHLGTTKNAFASTVSVEVWDGGAWRSCVDVVDRTAIAGASLAQSGYISFRPDIDNSSWVRERNSGDDVTGLTGTDIYNFFWCRFSWSADWTASVDIKHIGHRFSTDNDLFTRYPALNNTTLMDSFKSNSTNWDEQTFDAAEEIMNDLVERNIMRDASGAQILDFNRFKFSSVHKTAEIIYRGMGESYMEQMKQAAMAYSKTKNMRHYLIDLNQNADIDATESNTSGVSVLHR